MLALGHDVHGVLHGGLKSLVEVEDEVRARDLGDLLGTATIGPPTLAAASESG